jgi:hypothetical protein
MTEKKSVTISLIATVCLCLLFPSTMIASTQDSSLEIVRKHLADGDSHKALAEAVQYVQGAEKSVREDSKAKRLRTRTLVFYSKYMSRIIDACEKADGKKQSLLPLYEAYRKTGKLFLDEWAKFPSPNRRNSPSSLGHRTLQKQLSKRLTQEIEILESIGKKDKASDLRISLLNKRIASRHTQQKSQPRHLVIRSMDPKTTQVVDGVKVSLVKRPIYLAGHAVSLEIVLENTGKVPVYYTVTERAIEVFMSLSRVDEGLPSGATKRAPVKPTSWGKTYDYDPSKEAREQSKHFHAPIEPGKTKSFSINLARYFDLSRHGEYSLDILIPLFRESDRKAIRVSRKKYRFTVKDSKRNPYQVCVGSRIFDGMGVGIDFSTSYRHREPVPVRCFLANASKKEELVLRVPKPLMGFRIHLEQNGKAVPITRYGKTVMPPPRKQSDAKCLAISIKPGDVYRVPLDLARLFDLSLPGKYTGTVSWYRNDGKPEGSDKKNVLKTEPFMFETQ